MLPQGLEVLIDVLPQCGKGSPLMIMGDFSARPAPEPLDPVGVWVVGRGVYDPQMVVQLRQHLAHQARACRGMRAQIIDDDECYAPAGARPGDSSSHLGAEDIGSAAWGQPALKPAVTPVNEPEAIDLVVGPRRFD